MASSRETISRFVDENWPAIVADISELVSIQSIEDPATVGPDVPWGKGPRKALGCALSMAERLGLQVHDCAGIIGFADIPSDAEGQVATIAHLDVVPTGLGWDSDPFSLQRREVARWYVRNYAIPGFLFTPDSAWPVVCGEKGSHNAELAWKCDPQGRIVEIAGGTVRNAVAASAKAVVRAGADDLPVTDCVTVSPAGTGLSEVSAQGTGGHAAEPNNTVSAIGVLVAYLLENDICSSQERRWLKFENLFYSSTDDLAFGIGATDDLFPPLTIISGTIETRDGRFVQTTDCRYPKSTDPDTISAGIENTCAMYGVEYTEAHRGSPIYVDPESPEVQMLLDCYSEWFGGSSKPVTLGGGTYAKRFPYAVGFGPIGACDEDAPSWVGGIHGPNEAVLEESLKKALCTYISALERLSQVGTREGANRVW